MAQRLFTWLFPMCCAERGLEPYLTQYSNLLADVLKAHFRGFHREVTDIAQVRGWLNQPAAPEDSSLDWQGVRLLTFDWEPHHLILFDIVAMYLEYFEHTLLAKSTMKERMVVVNEGAAPMLGGIPEEGSSFVPAGGVRPTGDCSVVVHPSTPAGGGSPGVRSSSLRQASVAASPSLQSVLGAAGGADSVGPGGSVVVAPSVSFADQQSLLAGGRGAPPSVAGAASVQIPAGAGVWSSSSASSGGGSRPMIRREFYNLHQVGRLAEFLRLFLFDHRLHFERPHRFGLLYTFVSKIYPADGEEYRALEAQLESLLGIGSSGPRVAADRIASHAAHHRVVAPSVTNATSVISNFLNKENLHPAGGLTSGMLVLDGGSPHDESGLLEDERGGDTLDTYATKLNFLSRRIYLSLLTKGGRSPLVNVADELVPLALELHHLGDSDLTDASKALCCVSVDICTQLLVCPIEEVQCSFLDALEASDELLHILLANESFVVDVLVHMSGQSTRSYKRFLDLIRANAYKKPEKLLEFADLFLAGDCGIREFF